MSAGSLDGDLMQVAQDLVVEARSGFGDARLRRAVSTAYYAVFHAICRVCADSLVGSRSDAHREAIYRTVEHASARKVLTSAAARRISPLMELLGGHFADLQNSRHAADYRPITADPISEEQAKTLLEMARRVLFAIDLLSEDERMDTAILLISRPRS